MELISIIIPVYNTGKYLDKCIRSVIDQTYRELEILLINDGSTDDSGDICKKYASKDSRIVYISTDNQGRVNARKLGMEFCRGEIVTFVDSDDWLEPETYQQMYSDMRETAADILIYGYHEEGKDGIKQVKNTLGAGVYDATLLEQCIFPRMLCAGDFFFFGIHPYLWNKLYRKDCIKPYIMNLDERLRVGEDVVCLYPALLSATCIRIENKAGYHYLQHADSTMRSLQGCNKEGIELENIKIQYRMLKHFCEKSRYYFQMLPQIKRYILHHCMIRGFSYVNRISQRGDSFPFAKMKKKKNIIIYGAGGFGVAAYRFFMESSEYKVIGWTDSNWEKYQKMNYPIISPNKMLQQSFDYMVMAVMSKNAAEAITQSLLGQGVKEEKLVWLDDSVCALDGFAEVLLDSLENMDTSRRTL